MYTNLRLDKPKYMRIRINNIPDDEEEYNTTKYVNEDVYVDFEINRALYELAKARYITNKDLIKHLAPFYPSKKIPRPWHLKKHPIQFALVVDNFIAKYVNKDDIDHLFETIKTKYLLKVDWTGSIYLVIDLE